MIYNLSEEDYIACKAYLNDSNLSFGYESFGSFYLNTLDISKYDYDVNGMIENVFNKTISQYISTLNLYEYAEEKISVKQLDYKDSSGHSIIATEKPSGDFLTHISHNFCDKTSWSAVDDSVWELTPGVDKIFIVDKAELQFEHDISISPTEVYLEYYAWIGDGKTMMVQQFVFKSIRDLFALGNNHYHSAALPEIPYGLSTIVFNYESKLKFYGSENPGQLYKLVARVKDNTEVIGSYATIGMVASEKDML